MVLSRISDSSWKVNGVNKDLLHIGLISMVMVTQTCFVTHKKVTIGLNLEMEREALRKTWDCIYKVGACSLEL